MKTQWSVIFYLNTDFEQSYVPFCVFKLFYLNLFHLNFDLIQMGFLHDQHINFQGINFCPAFHTYQ